jgi:hypothetical protein
MADHTHQSAPHGRRVFRGEDVRQGEIILKRPWQRGIFIAGLVGVVVIALLLLGWAMSPP